MFDARLGRGLVLLAAGLLTAFALTLLPGPAAPDLVAADDAKKSDRGWVGLVIRNLTGPEKSVVGPVGVFIIQVQPGSPAEKAGFRPKDVIVKLDRRRPDGGAKQVAELFRSWKPGKRARFRVIRDDGSETELAVQVVAFDSRRAAKAALMRGVHFLVDRAKIKPETPEPGDGAKAALALLAIARAPEITRLRRKDEVAALVERVKTELGPRCDPATAGKPDATAAAQGELLNYGAALAAAALHTLDPVAHADDVKRFREYLIKRQLGVPGGAEGEFGDYAGAWNFLDADVIENHRGDCSVSSYVVEGLHRSGSGDDPATRMGLPAPSIEAAQRFMKARQNYGPLPTPSDRGDPESLPPARDGGFHFAPGESKAGYRAIPGTGGYVFTSYGTTTADGVRTLARLGVGADDPRIRAAVAWLADHDRFKKNPGFPDDHRTGFDFGLRYYWIRSFADAFAALGKNPIRTPDGRDFDWARAVIDYVTARQHFDGRWVSPVKVMSENDPIVSTALSLLAVSDGLAALEGRTGE